MALTKEERYKFATDVFVHEFTDDTTPEEVSKRYTEWGKKYEEDLVDVMQYVLPGNVAKVMSDNLTEKFGFNSDVRILDMGAGTGLLGEELQKLGYTNIDGVDMTQAFLDVAKEKGVYKNLIRGIMMTENSEGLGVEENQYDVVVSSGVLISGHVKGKGIDDFVHVVKPGGLAVFSIREDVHEKPGYGYIEKMEEHVAANKWKFVSKELKETTVMGGSWVYVYQLL